MRKFILIIFLFVAASVFGQWYPQDWYSKKSKKEIKFSTEALQYFNRMPVKPATDTLVIIAEFIDSLVSNGAWAKLDVSVLCANRDTTSALLNMKGTSFTGISIGSPTFTPYKGFYCETGKYVNAQFNPSTAGGVYTLNSASFGVYSNTDYILTNTALGGLLGASYSNVSPNSGSAFYFAINTDGYSFASNAHTVGLFSVSRTAVNSTRGYIDTDSVGSYNRVSNSLGNGKFYIGAINNGGSPINYALREIPYYYFGAGLTTQDVRNLSSCLSRLLVKLGADQLTRIVCDGNSLTGSVPNYVTKLQDTLSAQSYNLVNKGVPGQTIEQMNSLYPSKISHLPVHKKNVLIFWEGTNAIQSTGLLHADSVFRETKRYGLQAKATGKWDKIIVMTTLPFNTDTAKNLSRDTLNALLIEHYNEFADTIIDLTANPDIGQWGDQLNTTFYADKVHLTDVGQAIVMRMVYTALKNLRVIN